MTGPGDVASGSLVVAAAISVAAGAVSFASPCVLPLVPGYLAFVSGLSGADLADQVEGRRPARGAVVAGAGLFVLGFAAFFTLIGGAFGALGQVLVAQRGLLGRVGGILVAVLGLFLLGIWRPQRLQRERRALRLVHRGGLLAAFPLGVVFGAGWTPCIGPTLAAILTLTTVGQDTSPARGAVLAFTYALGLGVPFLLIAVAIRSGMGAVRRLRRHARMVERLGGALLLVVGVLLVTGLWTGSSGCCSRSSAASRPPSEPPETVRAHRHHRLAAGLVRLGHDGHPVEHQHPPTSDTKGPAIKARPRTSQQLSTH